MAASFTLRERTVTIGGYEYEEGGVRHVVLARKIRVREFTDAQIELRMFLSFVAGLAVAPIILQLFR
jgi:hypothetical protein